jgi:hypothetical protein
MKIPACVSKLSCDRAFVSGWVWRMGSSSDFWHVCRQFTGWVGASILLLNSDFALSFSALCWHLMVQTPSVHRGVHTHLKTESSNDYFLSFFVKIGSHYVAQAGCKLVGTKWSSCLSIPSSWYNRCYHRTWPITFLPLFLAVLVIKPRASWMQSKNSTTPLQLLLYFLKPRT